MSLNDLTTTELESLLMQETKKLTHCIREGASSEDKDNQRHIIEGIQKLMNQKKFADSEKTIYRKSS